MEIELEVSESEDYSEFPAEGLVTELCEKCQSESNRNKSLASEKKRTVETADKFTQTLSRKVWRKKRRQAQLKHQDAY